MSSYADNYWYGSGGSHKVRRGTPRIGGGGRYDRSNLELVVDLLSEVREEVPTLPLPPPREFRARACSKESTCYRSRHRSVRCT